MHRGVQYRNIFSIVVQVTNVVFLGSPSPAGFGFSQYAIAGAYATPMVVFLFWAACTVTHEGSPSQVAVIVGEIIGHFANDAIMHVTTRRNHGVFEAESRLW